MRTLLLTIPSFVERNHNWILSTTICLVMSSGLLCSIRSGNDLRYPDERDYYSLANNLATKALYSLDGLEPTAFRPPGYPLVLALFLSVGADIVFLRFLNFVFLSGSIFLLYALLKELTTTAAATIGALLTLLYPVLFYTAGILYPQTLGSFLLMLFVYLVLRRSPQSAPQAVLAGIVMGSLILAIPSCSFLLGVTLLYLLLWRRFIRASALILFGTIIVLTVWTTRNYVVFDSLIVTSTNSGINLLLGNSENTTANSGVNVDLSRYAAKAPESEVARDAYYRSEAMNFIVNNPGKALSLYVSKLLNYFNFRNELATKTEASLWKDVLMFFTYGPLIALFFLRLCLFKSFPFTEIEKYLVTVYLMNAFFQAIFFTRIRFRLPFDWLLIGVVAIFLHDILRKFNMRVPQRTTQTTPHLLF